MEDSRIIDLYWQRDQSAIAVTQEKYAGQCYAIAYGILHSREDAEECVNDTWSGAWSAMPPHRPAHLGAFLGRITRNLSLKRWRDRRADKRGGGVVPLPLSELEFALSGGGDPAEQVEAAELTAALDRFLAGLPADERRVFLCRYWYFDSVRDISARFGFGQSKVKMMLKRTRDKLLEHLRKEELWT